MREDWEYRKIGDVMSVERGGSPRPIKKYLTNSLDGLNWIKIGDASSSKKYIYETKEKITKDGLKKSRFVEEGDFILSNSMSFGRPYIMKTSGCIHDGWLVLKNKQLVELDKDFLYHLLCSPNIFEQFDKLAAGSTVRNLNIGLVSSVKIPIPPLSEQKKIVAILDEAFAAIDEAKANIEKNIENAGELFQSRLNEIFSQKGEGWDTKQLKEVCTIRPPKKEAKEKLNDDNLVSFVPMDILGIDEMYFKPTQEKNLKSVSGSYTYFSNGDVLLAKITPCFENGKLGIAKDLTNGVGFGSSEFIVYRSNKELLSEYLYYFLNQESFRKTGHNMMTGAVGHKRIPKEFYEEWPIPITTISKQKQIVMELDELNKYCNDLGKTYHQKIYNLEELKKSLLQKAFAGELT